MQLNEYQTFATRTFPSLGEKDLVHMVLGMMSEVPEFIDAILKEDDVNIMEEQADTMWYFANYCTVKGLVLQEVWDTRQDGISVTEKVPFGLRKIYAIGLLSDLIKKNMVYDRPINEAEELLYLKAILLAVEFELSALVKTFDDLCISLDRNIEKLKVRFPDKFTKDLANNRDLVSERKKLEGE